jgi:hypothetical protein
MQDPPAIAHLNSWTNARIFMRGLVVTTNAGLVIASSRTKS